MMKQKINYNRLTFLLLELSIFLLFSCAQENPDLVNPPPIFETVNIRFLNLSGDENAKSLVLEKTVNFDNISYKSISEPHFPPLDSALVQVFGSGSNLEYAPEQRQKFARNSNYIFVALPSNSDATEYENVDTVLIVQTTIIEPLDTNQCYIKFLNANPDVSISYSLKLGCPSGENVFENASTFRYCQSSGMQAIYEGKKVVSLVKNLAASDDPDAERTKLIGIFEIELNRLGQYILIVDKDDNMYFVDELATVPLNLQPLPFVAERNAYVRVVNLSSESVTVTRVPGEELTQNLNGNFIDKYNTIFTCNSTNLDRLILENNGIKTDSAYVSFDIFKKYSVLTFDKISQKAAKIVIVPPINDRFIKSSDKAVVRVVNGNYEQSGITVSLGARTANNQEGYISGDVLALDLQESETSVEKSISGGNIPISVFSSTQPTKYLFSSNVKIENGKEYIIAVDFSDGEGKLIAIEQDEELKSADFAQQSAFLQVINTVKNADLISLNIPDLIDDAKINYSNSLATFVPIGNNSVTVNGKNYNFTVSKGNRILLVATNTENDLEIFDIQAPPMNANATLKYRVINASNDTPILQVNSDSTDYSIIDSDINYKSTSRVIEQYRDRKFSFFFKNQNLNKDLLKIGDLLMTLNKNYSIVFHGNETLGYGIAVLQEY